MPSLLKRAFPMHISLKKQGKFAFHACFQEFLSVFKENSGSKSQKIVILPSKRKEKFPKNAKDAKREFTHHANDKID